MLNRTPNFLFLLFFLSFTWPNLGLALPSLLSLFFFLAEWPASHYLSFLLWPSFYFLYTTEATLLLNPQALYCFSVMQNNPTLLPLYRQHYLAAKERLRSSVTSSPLFPYLLPSLRPIICGHTVLPGPSPNIQRCQLDFPTAPIAGAPIKKLGRGRTDRLHLAGFYTLLQLPRGP